MELVEEAYMIFVVDALHNIVMNVLPRWRKTMYSSIIVPWEDNWEMIPSYLFKWAVNELDAFIHKL